MTEIANKMQRFKGILNSLLQFDAADIQDPEAQRKFRHLQARAIDALEASSKPGNPNLPAARKIQAEKRTRAAADFRNSLMSLVKEARAAGHTNYGEIADFLNQRHVTTFSGKPWNYTRVVHLLRKSTDSTD